MSGWDVRGAMRKSGVWISVIGLGFCLDTVGLCGADRGSDVTLDEPSEGSSFFAKENWSEEAGVAMGGGVGMKIFGSDVSHDFALTKFHLGWNRKKTSFAERWYRGQFGFFQELMAGGQFDPEAAYLVGLTPIFRYRFTSWKRFHPLLEGGAGMMMTDIGEPSLGSKFEFYQQAGTGFEWQHSERLTFASHIRFVHISNAGIKRPNRGINGLFFFVGANWKF